MATGGVEANGAGGIGGMAVMNTGGSGGANMSGGGGGTGGMAGQAQTQPETVTIELEGAFMGVGKSDQTQWDGFGSVPPAAWAIVGAALGAPAPLVALAKAFSDPAIVALQKPDVYGNVRLDGPGFTRGPFDLATKVMAVQDNFAPVWPNRVIFQGVPIGQDVRLRVELTDSDLSDDDPAGVATINMGALMMAHMNKGVFGVDVSGQTGKQILFLTISVRTEALCSATSPCGAGYQCRSKSQTWLNQSRKRTLGFQNLCSEDIAVRLFDSTHGAFWPGDPKQVYRFAPNDSGNIDVSCVPDAAVCFGAENKSQTLEWGASLAGDKSCDDCCVKCPMGASVWPPVPLVCN